MLRNMIFSKTWLGTQQASIYTVWVSVKCHLTFHLGKYATISLQSYDCAALTQIPSEYVTLLVQMFHSTVLRLWSGKPRNLGSIPSRGKRSFSALLSKPNLEPTQSSTARATGGAFPGIRQLGHVTDQSLSSNAMSQRNVAVLPLSAHALMSRVWITSHSSH
jgi:hypothetical protein